MCACDYLTMSLTATRAPAPNKAAKVKFSTYERAELDRAIALAPKSLSGRGGFVCVLACSPTSLCFMLIASPCLIAQELWQHVARAEGMHTAEQCCEAALGSKEAHRSALWGSSSHD
jgi:hypothetical protein